MKIKQFGLLFLLAVVLLGFNACATMNDMNEDISSLQSDVASLKKENQNLQDLRRQVADMSVQVDEMQNNLQEIRGQVDENQHSLKKLGSRVGTGGPAPSGGAPSPTTQDVATPPPAPVLDAEEVYNNAYRIFQDGRYPESRSAFVKFLQQFPQTEFSDNAQYWIGEAYLKEGKTEQAILAFEDVVKKFPQGNKVPDALVKEGICFKVLGDGDNARIILQRVIDKYPNSPQANTARREIEGLM